MTDKQAAYALSAKTVIKNLNKRNMNGYYCADRKEALSMILSMIPQNSSISWGGSATLSEIGLPDALKTASSYELIDRSLAITLEEKKKVYGQTATCDYFLMSSNAITMDGELINIDGTGNRVAALIYGPEHVFVIAGMNKIVSNVDQGLSRTRDIAAVANAIRLDRKTPCGTNGRCGDCLLPDCMCSHMVITRRCNIADRISIFLIGEELGY